MWYPHLILASLALEKLPILLLLPVVGIASSKVVVASEARSSPILAVFLAFLALLPCLWYRRSHARV